MTLRTPVLGASGILNECRNHCMRLYQNMVAHEAALQATNQSSAQAHESNSLFALVRCLAGAFCDVTGVARLSRLSTKRATMTAYSCAGSPKTEGGQQPFLADCVTELIHAK